MQSMHFLNSGYKITSEQFRRAFSWLRNYSLKSPPAWLIITASLEISISTCNLVLWNIWSVRCLAIIKWQWFLLFKLTFREGHYQHALCYSLLRFLKSWNGITSWSKQNLSLVFPLLSLQVNEANPGKITQTTTNI